MDFKKNKIAIVLAVLLVIAIGYIAYDQIRDAMQANYEGYYNAGARDGQQATLNAMVGALNKDGYVQITVPTENNQTATVTLVPYQAPEQAAKTTTTKTTAK